MNLKELSAILGLSPTTVSRALNGYPEVSEATRRRVLAEAKRQNYHPDTRAKRLATGRAMTIGHILPVSKEHEMVNPIFADFLAGAGEVYAGAGYDLSLAVVRDEDEADAYRDLARRGTVDGVVLHGPKLDDPRIPLLRELGLPFVVHGRSTDAAGDYNWVDVDNRRAFARAARHLLDLGHRRIALINGMADMDFALRRLFGFADALAECGLPVEDRWTTHGEMTETYGYETVRGMLEARDPPTAFLIASMIPAIGARRAIHDMGLRIGHDVSVAIHDDGLSYFRNEGTPPVYTAVRSSVRKAGRLCADLLLKNIADPGRPSDHILLEAELSLGQSSGPAPRLFRQRKSR